jgi:Zn-dependent protease with chaperone function
MLVLLGGLAGTQAGWCDDIVQVLDRSQDMRLAAMQKTPVDPVPARRLQADFDRLTANLPQRRKARLQVVRGPVWAETMHGGVVVANQTLADLPEGARLFILAHELGHVTLDHWLQMSLLFQKWVPGEVTQRHTDAIATLLARDAGALAHRQEFEADAYAARALQALGVPMTDMFEVFNRLGGDDESPTHPSAAERMAALRALGFRDPAHLVASRRHLE